MATEEFDTNTEEMFKSMNTKKSQTIGYIRVSTLDQNIERQLSGIELDKVFIDKISGIENNRPELNKLLNFIREGDVLIIHSLDRLSRRLDFLIQLIENITAQGVTIKFLKENLVLNKQSMSPTDRLIFHFFGMMAEWHRSSMKEAQADGIAKAKQKTGDDKVYKGRIKKLKPQQVKQLKIDASSLSKKQLCEKYEISIATLYRYLK